MATQSSGDTNPPTALATLYLEDGTKLTGQSFGCHESVEGEVSETLLFLLYILHHILYNLNDRIFWFSYIDLGGFQYWYGRLH